MNFGVETFHDNEIHEQIPDTKVEVLSYQKFDLTKEDRVVFDLVNAPASHANALRRTLLSNVPSVAFDFVEVYQNASVIPDEVICHRIGLIPIDFHPKYLDDFVEDENIETIDNPKTTLLFGLCVIGGEGPEPDLSNVRADGRIPPYYTGESGRVLSSHFVWIPLGDQKETLPVVPRMLHGNIEITRLHPGQKIEIYARAIRGVGEKHAKFSPVSTAFYRLVPKIEVNPDANEKKKNLLVETCPCKVFEIEDSEVVVKNPRNCTFCKECLRLKRLEGVVNLSKEPNHYEFTVESFGVRSSPEKVKEALEILNKRSQEMKTALNETIDQ